MHDKQVRRRRAVLVVLVVISLLLLTDYFGESSSSPLHRVQRGIVAVLSPVQIGRQHRLLAGLRRRQLGVDDAARQDPARPAQAPAADRRPAAGQLQDAGVSRTRYLRKQLGLAQIGRPEPLRPGRGQRDQPRPEPLVPDDRGRCRFGRRRRGQRPGDRRRRPRRQGDRGHRLDRRS